MSNHKERGQFLYERHRYKEAVTEFRQAIGQDPDDSYMHCMLATSLYAMDQYPDAIKAITEALRLDPERAHYHYILALIYVQKHDSKKAEASIKNALALKSDSAEYYAIYAAVYLLRGKHKEALKQAEIALSVNPHHLKSLNMHTQALMGLNRIGDAEISTNLALQVNPEDDVALSNKGDILLRLNKHDEAISHFREALRSDPDSNWARLGALHAMKKKNFIFWMLCSSYEVMWSMDIRVWLLIGLVQPIRLIFVPFMVLAWLGKHYLNLLLMRDPLGQLMLKDADKDTARALGKYSLVATAIVILLFLCKQFYVALISWWFFVFASIPFIRTFEFPKEKRLPMYIYTAIVAIVGIVGFGCMGIAHEFPEAESKMLSGRGVLLVILFHILAIATLCVKQPRPEHR
jgi:tetratricopeptide (TPR) repeat protein